ncbi:alpha/beta fold hydrolase [Streptomyces sp. NPDC059627]
MPKLDVSGATLVYDDEGPRDGAGVPLVFVHGWTANRHRWDHPFGYFADRRRVVRLDLRGHGDSTGTGVRDLGVLADDLRALLDHLRIERCVLVGHSMGGMIAQLVTLDRPARVERLVLVDSISRMTYSFARGVLLTASKLLPFKLFVAVNIRRAFGPGFPREEADKYVKAAQSLSEDLVMPLFDAMRAFDVLDRLGEIKAPTLLVHGYHDVQLPLSQMLRMADGIPDAVARIVDAGHEVPLEKPAELTAALDAFVNGRS